MHYEGCFGKAIAFSIGYYAFSMGDWVKNVPRIVPQCNSRQNRPSLPRNLLQWPMYKVIITDFQNLVQFDSYRPYRPFWHDVTSAMFARPKTIKQRACWYFKLQTNPVVVEPFSNVKAFFSRNKSTQLLVTLVKTLYIFFCTTWHSIKTFVGSGPSNILNSFHEDTESTFDPTWVC